MDTWTAVLFGAFQSAVARMGLVVPQLLALGAWSLVGWGVATLARRAGVRLLQAMAVDQRCLRWGVSSALGRLGIRQGPIYLVGQLVFGTVLGVGILLGVDALDLPAATGLVAHLLSFLPNLLVALLLLGTGWVVAHFLAQATLLGAVNAQLAGAPVLASAVRWLVLVFAGAAGLTQLGIAREMVLLAFGLTFGGTVLALAVAVGLGGQDLAREILDSRLRKPIEDEPSPPSARGAGDGLSVISRTRRAA